MTENNEFWEQQMDLLAQQEFVIIDDFFTNKELLSVHSFFQQKEDENAFKKAAIGVSGKEKIIGEIRGDYTYWLDKERDQEQLPIYSTLDLIKKRLNESLFLSLSDYEFHLAHYPAGSFYKKHLDQFNRHSNRMISMIIYLNKEWTPVDGGELCVYPKDSSPIAIEPIENRCVLFRSDTLFHEVLKAHKSRKSLTGWMLYQPTTLSFLG